MQDFNAIKRLIVIFFVIIAIFLSAGCQSKEVASYQTITTEEAHQLLQEEKGVILLDVRSKAEYDERHIPGSILLSVDNLKEKVGEVISDKNAFIIVYCRSGNRSAKAARVLAESGYSKVYDMGGINNWKYETQP
ncbi:MAG: rhodanese-like domain-containing protein [Firmicutes bacterium HGW-Firmicutes-12]|jgi:rhodanese-related sulfurtransferase|nr:MAG: rhodanese-like domain-containing protein [Firmicutes bacterium HGW-Firmicutes-12]